MLTSCALHCVLLSVAMAPTWRTIFWTTGAAWQLCATRRGKWLLVHLAMNFDERYALCIQKLYHRPRFTVGGSWNKSVHLQPLQLCYCENSGTSASASVMRLHYSITYTHSLHTINGLITVGWGGNLLCGHTRIIPNYIYRVNQNFCYKKYGRYRMLIQTFFINKCVCAISHR